MVDDKYPSDWQKRRMNVFRRDDFECAGCGEVDETETGGGLEAHHIQPIHDGGGHELDNLITLCQECHVLTHKANEESPAEPIVKTECGYCGEIHLARNSSHGSFCSEHCYRRFRSQKMLNAIDEDTTVCSTCFADVTGENVCSNCGAFELTEDQSGDVTDTSIHRQNFAEFLLDASGFFQKE